MFTVILFLALCGMSLAIGRCIPLKEWRFAVFNFLVFVSVIASITIGRT